MKTMNLIVHEELYRMMDKDGIFTKDLLYAIESINDENNTFRLYWNNFISPENFKKKEVKKVYKIFKKGKYSLLILYGGQREACLNVIASFFIKKKKSVSYNIRGTK